MVDPATVIAVAKVGLSLFGASQEQKYRKRVARLVNQLQQQHLVEVTRPEFDKRVQYMRTGNDQQYGLYEEGFQNEDAISRDTFNNVLGEERSNFDEQLALTTGFDIASYDSALRVLDAFAQARITNTNRYQAAQAEQDALQAMSDALADQYVSGTGQPGFDVARLGAEAGRNTGADEQIGDGLTALPTPPGRAQPVIDNFFRDQQERGIEEARGDAYARNRVSAYGDAVLDRERKLRGFSEGLDALGTDARLAAAPIGAQNFATNLRASNAQADEAGRLAIEDDMTRRLSDIFSSYRANRSGTMQDFGTNMLDSNGEFYDNQIGSVSDWTGRRVNASSQYEANRSNLLNYQISSLNNSSSGAGSWTSALSQGLDSIGGQGGLFSSIFNRRRAATKPAYVPTRYRQTPVPFLPGG